MKPNFHWLALPLACLSLSVVPVTAAAGGALTPAEREAIVATATHAAAQSLHIDSARLRLVPERVHRQGEWVFMTAQMQDAAGQRFDYTGTDQLEAAQNGGKSSLCAALLRREGTAWKLLDIAVGPTDVAWENWPEAHKAPKALFQ